MKFTLQQHCWSIYIPTIITIVLLVMMMMMIMVVQAFPIIEHHHDYYYDTKPLYYHKQHQQYHVANNNVAIITSPFIQPYVTIKSTTTSMIRLRAISSSSISSTANENITTTSSTIKSKDDNDTPATTTSSSSSSPNTMIMMSGNKIRRLKDMMWIRETLEDLTAAEFACSVEMEHDKVIMMDSVSSVSSMTSNTTTTTTTGWKPNKAKRPRKRAVDYEKLLVQLNQRLRDLGCDTSIANIDETKTTENTSNSDSTTDVDVTTTTMNCILQEGVGMGCYTYTEIQRNALLERLLRTRFQLIEVIHGYQIEMSNTDSIPLFIQNNLPSLPRIEIPKEDIGSNNDNNQNNDISTLSPKLYVRDDGTVDWDGALSSGAALRKFGTAVWARINGRDTIDDHSTTNHQDMTNESNDNSNNNNNTDTTSMLQVVGTTTTSSSNSPNQHGHGSTTKVVTAKIVETPEIIEAREKLHILQKQLYEMEKDHYKLLNSVISQGQATANVKLATLAPKVRSEIQSSASSLENMKVRVSFQTLIYELERIYTYLMGELGNPSLNGYIPLQDRLNVAEFGLLESQIDTFNRQFMDNDTVDEDVLAVVLEQLTDFKRRLGIDYYVAGLSFDREAIGTWLGDLWVKTKKGLTFYVKGVRLFWNDLVFCLRLINRAAQGYTLKPREVRTIRRTFKDVITFIPFVIILLIPLSPIGHVLVFGAIQRFFPDFFPSCFTEQRQNLLQLYETAEYSELVINENWNAKLSRFTVAFAYVIADAFRTLFFKVTGFRKPDMTDDDTNTNSSTMSNTKKS